MSVGLIFAVPTLVLALMGAVFTVARRPAVGLRYLFASAVLGVIALYLHHLGVRL